MQNIGFCSKIKNFPSLPNPLSHWERVARRAGRGLPGEHRSTGIEADFGEAQEDEAEDGSGVFLSLEAGVGSELVGGVPKALFERGAGNICF